MDTTQIAARNWAKRFIAMVKKGLTVDRRSGLLEEIAADNKRLRAENEQLRRYRDCLEGDVNPAGYIR